MEFSITEHLVPILSFLKLLSLQDESRLRARTLSMVANAPQFHITLREEIFAGINFREFFFGHFTGINFRELGFNKDFAGINFRELSLTNDFAGINAPSTKTLRE